MIDPLSLFFNNLAGVFGGTAFFAFILALAILAMVVIAFGIDYGLAFSGLVMFIVGMNYPEAKVLIFIGAMVIAFTIYNFFSGKVTQS